MRNVNGLLPTKLILGLLGRDALRLGYDVSLRWATHPRPSTRSPPDRSDRLHRRFAQLPHRHRSRTHTAPVVSAQAWVKTGSVAEQRADVGQALHFLEHLLAKASAATTNRTEQQSHDILGRIRAPAPHRPDRHVHRPLLHQHNAVHAAEAWTCSAIDAARRDFRGLYCAASGR